jgi:DNA-binding GntR family transcriptional regulator
MTSNTHGIQVVSKRLNRVEQVHLEIRQRIVRGVYPPGSPLSDTRLASDVRASRTPVREALSRLLEEGYVERVPGRGFFVARITVAMIRNVFEVRRLLEGAAAAHAAERAAPQDVARLRGLARLRSAAGRAGTRKAFDVNSRFHQTLAAASGNALLVDLVRHCIDQVTRFMALGVSLQPFQSAASREHKAIVDAIEAKDPGRARAAVESHLDDAARFLLESLLKGDLRGSPFEASAAVPMPGAGPAGRPVPPMSAHPRRRK